MDNMQSLNRSIQCSVFSCKHNNNQQGYCVLDKIVVGTHEPDPTDKQCADCRSFVKKNCCNG